MNQLARLPPLGFRVRISGHSMLILLGRNGIRQVFFGVSPVFSLLQISSNHFSMLISFISFHFISPAPVMVRQAWCTASLLFTDLQYRGFIASHPSTRPCVGHEFEEIEGKMVIVKVTVFWENLPGTRTVKLPICSYFSLHQVIKIIFPFKL